MSPAAKSWLSDTVRSLRARLIKDLSDGLESTYRLSIASSRAELDQERACKRRRLEEWLEEQARAGNRGLKETEAQARQRHRDSATKLVAATWLNRLVVLGQLEALGLVRIPVFTGGWNSKGFREFREFAPTLATEDHEGYPLLLRLVFEDLALELPGLFGPAGLSELIPLPTASLRHLVETLQADSLPREERQALWRDDTLLGWVYQFWNDPERELLDEKIRNGGKIENHEIAAKTQLFTDRYMVEWLLQNSLGQIWLEMCARQGWTSEVVASGTLERLEARRAEWRGRRERGEVEEEALMPLESELEERWKYYVPRPLAEAPGEGVPDRLSDLKLLDPACGSGHFLVIAFDLLVALYQEEAARRGESLSPEELARSIVENNLHGLDIDPRAVQMAAAALWLKVQSFAPKTRLGRVNLVASNLGLAALPPQDPALLELLVQVEEEAGIARELTRQLVETLKGADHLGSLLKVGEALDRALLDQSSLWAGRALTVEEARATLLARLEEFVAHHSRSEDLGLRLRGQQLASGVRFLRLVEEGQYHLVVGNPPYQSKGKLAESAVYERLCPFGKSDLFAGFMERGPSLLIRGGLAGYVTLGNWMSLGTYEELRQKLLLDSSLTAVLDLGKAAFGACDSTLISVCISLWRAGVASTVPSIAVRPIPPKEVIRDLQQHNRLQRALLCGTGRFDFHPQDLRAIPGQPLIYWWSQEFLERYASYPLTKDVARVTKGICTTNNGRFTRFAWEPAFHHLGKSRIDQEIAGSRWQPFINGAKGTAWFEPVFKCIIYENFGLELHVQQDFYRLAHPALQLINTGFYFRPGIAFSMIGSSFTARAHRYRSVFGNAGSSVFPQDIPSTLCLLNSSAAKCIMESLNPTVNFEVGDVNRLPLFPIESAPEIVAILEAAFSQHEQARETSVEFRRPGPSPWRAAQEWAQRAVDRPAGAPLPEYVPQLDPQGPRDELSYRLGRALGRFDDDGIALQPPPEALPQGLLFLASSGSSQSLEQAGLSQQADYLRTKFFAEDHLKRYEKRPIYLPLSSEKKNFVVWCAIHRWDDNTLLHVLGLLREEQQRLEGELADAAQARSSGDRKAQLAATQRHQELLNLVAELAAFLKAVQDIAERGAPCEGCSPREVDAPFRMDLDDGVMINSAALWPLLLPQGWKEPKTWWSELCNAKGKKDYDWSHLAARYFPARVDRKCQQDPSLAVAHGVFWKYHPEKAYQWELRLQSPEELGPDFRLEEEGSAGYRADFELRHPDKVRELRQAEQRRRERKAGGAGESPQAELDFEDEDEE